MGSSGSTHVCLSPMSLLQSGSKSSEGVGWEEGLGVGRGDHRMLWHWDSCRWLIPLFPISPACLADPRAAHQAAELL